VFNIRIAQAAGMETVIPGGMASPPLTFYGDAIECAFRTLEAGMPIAVDTGTVFGATGPATLAGSLAIYNAELIAGIVLIQLAKPGTRISVFGFPNPQNMRTGSLAFGAIGISLFNVALNQIWRQYGVPLRNTAPAYTSSKQIDFQSGYERAIPAILGAISGVHFLHLHGGMHGELTHHPVQSILDDDLAGMIGRFMEGIEVNDETLAIDLINEVGPIPGIYLNKKHTRNWWKREQFVPRAADRLTYPEWRNIGKKNCLDYAKEVMAKILATHKVSIPLTSSQHQEIGGILQEAREHYREKGLISDEEWEIYKRKVLKSPDYPFA